MNVTSPNTKTEKRNTQHKKTQEQTAQNETPIPEQKKTEKSDIQKPNTKTENKNGKRMSLLCKRFGDNLLAPNRYRLSLWWWSQNFLGHFGPISSAAPSPPKDCTKLTKMVKNNTKKFIPR